MAEQEKQKNPEVDKTEEALYNSAKNFFAQWNLCCGVETAFNALSLPTRSIAIVKRARDERLEELGCEIPEEKKEDGK